MVAGVGSLTAEAIVLDALQKLRIYDPDESLADADANKGLELLNDMIDSWSTESLTCFAILEQHFTLVVGKTAYTIGLSGGADVALVRPIRLINGYGAAYILDDQGNRYGVNVVPRNQFNLIGTTTATSNLPDTLFYDPQIPLGVLNVWPVPSIGWSLYFDSYQQLTAFPDLVTAVSVPPGYAMAMKTNLAVFIKPYFKAAQLDPELVAAASWAKANIKRSNLRPNRAIYDPEIIAHAAGTYNIQRDSGSAATD